MTSIVLLASIAGWRSGQQRRGQNFKLKPAAAAGIIGLVLLWFFTAWRARFYADTDRPGAELTEWFAHSGKWLVLIAVAGFGNGFICGARQIPPVQWRKALYFAAVAGIAGLVVWRTVPVYFLLGNGRRDANHFVRQSADYECTCGAVALLNYLEQFHGVKNLTEREVSKACGVTAEGTTTAALVRAAHQYGFTNAMARVLSWDELEQQKLPVIVFISTLPQVHHATLLVSLDENSASFIDPAYGLWKTSSERFQLIWYGKTVLLEQRNGSLLQR